MGLESRSVIACNHGIISKFGMARMDLKRYAFAAEQQFNWMPRAVGSMMLRPGWGKVGESYNDAKAVYLPFIFSLTDTAIIELTNQIMRVFVAEQPIARVSVSTAVTNGNFTSDLSGWTNTDQAGCVSAWLAGSYMSLVGNGFNYAIEKQTVTVSGGDSGKEHALRIVVQQGKVMMRVGSGDGLDDYVNETTLTPGTHSIAFTPAGNFFLRFYSSTTYASLVKSCNIEAAGVMTLPTPWVTADLGLIRSDQSADVIFLAADSTVNRGVGYQQYKIERRAVRSWSIVTYLADDGPFLLENGGPVSLNPSALNGDIVITATQPVFYANHVGGLIRITSTGQQVSSNLSNNLQFTNAIEVTGIGSQRGFQVTVTGTWAGNLSLQRSVGSPGAWIDIEIYTTNQSKTFSDGLDNQIIYYRLGFPQGDYTSGTAVSSLNFSAGSILGIARITIFNNAQSVSASVLKDFGGIGLSSLWAFGQWSDRQGWPTAVLLHEGRLCWEGRGYFDGSVSDAYASFDDTVVGDSGPLNIQIGSGPLDSIHWSIALQALVMGGEAGEHFVLSNTLQEPLTPTDFNIKTYSTQGSAAVAAVKKDLECIFVQRSGQRIFTVSFNPIYLVSNIDELTKYAPDVTGYGSDPNNPVTIVKIVLQRQPDTRLHCVLSNGTVAVLVYDKLEDIQCLVLMGSTNGLVEDALIMPGVSEDAVYYSVNRTIGGTTKRFLEKWAQEAECIGGTVNKNADCHLTFNNGSPSNSITGAAHLAGQQVVVWADGIDYSPTDAAGNQTLYTVSGGGVITMASGVTVTQGVYGLPYSAQYQSTKLAYASKLGSALNQKKRVPKIGLLMANTHMNGLRYGRTLSFSDLNDLPGVEDGTAVPANTVWDEYDKEMIDFPSDWGPDERVCLFAQAPRPCTLLGFTIDVQTSDST